MRTKLPAARARLVPLALAAALATPAAATVRVQCPGDVNGDAVPDPLLRNNKPNPEWRPNVRCRHLTAGDGFSTMADGTRLYTFGFADVTGHPAAEAMERGMLAAQWPAPLIVVDEGDELYLTLTNVGMHMRPDLFDPHSVHWHGFPEAAPVFDGVPDSSVSINMGASLTYYYRVVRPGTYLYHCHVEATEHMQMGMLGNLYVRPAQDRLAPGTVLAGGFVHRAGQRYAYNDGDGSTRYDVDVPLQLGSFDRAFHEASESVQPLPFALMRDTYPMLNGRGYPDTLRPEPLLTFNEVENVPSQPLASRIEARTGQRVLLRLSNVSVTRFFTLASELPMRIVGKDARQLRGPGGTDLSYRTHSVTLGGGEAADAIVDLAGVPPGTYVLHAANLSQLANHDDDFGGIMTELTVTP